MITLKKGGLLFSAALLTCSAISAQAATLALSYSTTATGTTGAGAITNLSAGTYLFGDALGSLTQTVYTPTSGQGAGVNFEFYDDFVFTVSGATVSTVTTTLNLDNYFHIDNLMVRIYSAAGNPILPALGTPSGTEIDANSFAGPIFGNTIAFGSNTPLSAGTYVLEVRGAVSGDFGGNYIGALKVAPVPIPGSTWLMGSAVLGLIGARRRS